MPAINTNPENESTQSTTTDRCSYSTSDGRRCRMPLSPNHPTLCTHHATPELQAAEAARIAAQLTGPSSDVKSTADINRVLAQLFSAVSAKKVDLKQGSLLAYIAQLMLQTIKTADTPAPPNTLPSLPPPTAL